MALLRRTMGALSRRLDRPELLAAVYPAARQPLREEIAISAILAATLRGDGTYVDVGTNRGQILREAIRIAPHGRHVVFEPIPRLAAELVRLFPGADCRQMAIGAHPATAEFCHFRALDGWSGLQRSREISDELGDPEYIEVEVSTLDAEIGALLPTVIKIDVEGAERDVIEGARSLMLRARPVVIFEHVASAAALYGAPSSSLWDLLAELEYEVFAVTGDGPFTRARFAENTVIVNWLARPIARTAQR
jgi:FkbM family methyltransferase